MNQGKRLLRNTVFSLWGAAALYVGATRLYATTDADTAPWVRNALSLGLRQTKPSERPDDIDLATVRDFTHVSVSGRFNVEIVGGAEYKVVVTPEAGQEMKYHAWRDDETLRIWQEGENKGAALATLHRGADAGTTQHQRQPSHRARHQGSGTGAGRLRTGVGCVAAERGREMADVLRREHGGTHGRCHLRRGQCEGER